MLSVHNPTLGSRVVPTWGRPPSSRQRSEVLTQVTRTHTLDLHPRLSPWHLLTFRFLFPTTTQEKQALLPAASCCHKTRTTCLKLGPTAMSHYHNGLISWRLLKAFSSLFKRSFHGSGWVDGDTADEISRPSMHFFRRRKSTPRCVLLLCLINQPAIDLWSTFHGPVLHSRSHAAAETRSGWHGAEAAAPSCRCADKKTLVAVCVTLLSWHFECYQLSFMLAQTQRASLRNPGEGSVQNMQGQMEIHIGGLSLGE